jgi:transcriptional antiterminator NusG
MVPDKVLPEAETAAVDDTSTLPSAPLGSGGDTTEDALVITPAAAEEEEQPEPSAEAGDLEAQEPEAIKATDEVAEAQAAEEEEEPEPPAEAVDLEAQEPEAIEATDEVAEAQAAEEEEEPEPPAEAVDLEAQEPEAIEATDEAAEAQAEEMDDGAEAEADPYAPQDSRAWYVVHCYSGYENKVKHNLEQRIETMQMQDQIFQVVVPTEDEMEVRDGKRRVVERRVFPGYILVQMTLNEDSWYAVRNTPGVTGFVGMGNEPTPLRSEEVQAIMKRMEAEAPKIKVTFKSGQKVRIIDGPFNEFIGMVDEIDMERAKVRVLVSFFGRETPVELDFLQVEKA